MKRFLLFYSRLFVFIFLLISKLNAQTIDLSKPVGSPDGKGGVSGSGTATYSVPIKVLPGINNMIPNVSLEYNSADNEDISGTGWHISSMSFIKRAGKNNYYNGLNTPVQYTNTNDAFELDGQRLFPISGSNGANGTVYGLENEQFSKIESFGGSETKGPDWFKITLKNGTVMEYGNASNSIMPTNDGVSNMMWFLNKITDINGNYQTYTYAINPVDRTYQIAMIDYTGNTEKGITPSTRIRFLYTVKTYWQTSDQYEGGASLRNAFLLSNISVLKDLQTVVHSYDLSYTTKREKYLLQSITEKGSDGTALNPITFTYGSNTSASDIVISGYRYPLTRGGSYAGDFEGNGRSGVLSVNYTIDNNGVRHDNSYSIFSDFSSYANSPAMSPLTLGVSSTAAQIKANSYGYRDYLTNDFDGDGKEDVVIWNGAASGSDLVFSGLQISYSRYYTATAGWGQSIFNYNSIPSSFGLNFKYVYRNGTAFGQSFIQGDFNGDGIQDYILILGANSSNSFKAYFSSPRLGIFNQEILNFGVGGATGDYAANSIASANQLIPIDFDGDGDKEILVVTGSQSYVLSVYPISAASGYNYAAKVLYSTTNIQGSYPVYPGDFNGDGKTDLLYRASYNSATANWYILTSTGLAYSQSNYVWANRPYLPQDGAGSSHVISVADYDHDGKTDVWQSLDLSSTANKHNIDYYHGTSFHLETYSTSGSSINGTVTSTQTGYPNAVIGDYNGDGKSDMLSINSSNQGIFLYPKPFKEDLFMSSATDGLGVKETFSYDLLTNSSSYSPFEQLYGRTWYYEVNQISTLGMDPNVNNPGSLSINGNPFNVLLTPLYIVSNHATSNGLGAMRTDYYSYKDATFSKLRGFLGFGSINSMDDATGIVTGTENKFNSDLLLPHLWHQYTYLYPDTLSDIKFYDTLQAISPNNYFDKRFVRKINFSVSYDNLKGNASRTDNTYDNYGNITSSTTKVGTLSGLVDISPTNTAITTTTFGTHGTPVPASPDNITVSSTRNGQSALSNTATYGYDSKGNVTSRVDYSGQPKAITTTLTRDGFGNVTQADVSGSGVGTRTVKYTYESSGRFPLQKEVVGSGISKKTVLTYESTFGNVASVKSPDGLTNSFTYDVFGRLNKTVKPEGYDITQTLAWESSIGRYSIQVTRPGGGSNTKTYFDILGRPIRKEISGFNNSTLVSTNVYDVKGQVSSSVSPHYNNETAVTTTFQYDDKGRPTQASNGTVSATYAYDKLSGGQYRVTSTNGAGQAKSRIMDAANLVVSAQDNGGTVNYSYDSHGSLLQSSVNGSASLTNTYDIYDNKISSTERNSGSTTYQFDAFHQLTSMTDALGHNTTLQYDQFGRVINKQGVEGTTTFEYWKDVTSGYCNDNPSKITGFSGDLKEYTYDNLNRLIQQKITVDGSGFLTQYGYDTYSNLTQTTYPSGVVINRTYDNNGIEMQVKNGSTTLFTATAMNSLGKYTAYTMGNGKSSTESYNLSTGAPTQFVTTDIQNLTFSFDAQTGNLNQRKDVINNLQEDFTYDNLNRLLTVKVNEVQTQVLTYDGNTGSSIGNIASKTDAGKYTYNSSKVNAVAYITNPAGNNTPPSVIPTTQQDITYTPFLKTQKITDNNNVIEYTYGSDLQRIKSVLTQTSNVVETKYYLGDMERQIKAGITRDILYIKAGNGLGAIIVTENGTSNTYYTYKDYLGSILTVTNSAGAIVASQSFDAWGRKRNPTNGSYDNISTIPDWLYRGYTGHEHLDEFGLINMNGRMYDPVQGRMMSADLFIGDAYSTQSYNMYSYVSNNPLRFVDPSGYLEDVTVTSHPKDNDDDGNNDYGGNYGASWEMGMDYGGGDYGGGDYGGGGPGGGGPGGGTSSSSSNSNNVSKNGVTVTTKYPKVYVQPLVYTEFYITNLVNSLLTTGNGFDSYNVLDEFVKSSTKKNTSNQRSEQGVLSELWNSAFVRAIVPDELGIHISVTLVPTIGAGYSYNVDLLTRGKDAGIHMSQSLSGRVGEEVGIGISLTRGNYIGSGQNSTYNSLTGWGVDANGSLGPISIGAWGSIDGDSYMPTWLGTSVGVGWGVGGSAGLSYTWPIN